MELTPWDEFQWDVFIDMHRGWRLVEYGKRVKIANNVWEISAISMEVALNTAMREITARNKDRRDYYWRCL